MTTVTKLIETNEIRIVSGEGEVGTTEIYNGKRTVRAMTHENRGRLTVKTDGNWRLYTNTLPANSTALGTVTRDETDTGALVRIEATGAYVQVNASVIRSLDGRKVAAALGTAGRPSEMAGGKPVNTYLDAESIAIATRLGNGNVSEGIRKALKQAGEHVKVDLPC